MGLPRTPAFWRRDGLAARALAPISAVYGRISGRRMLQPPRVVPGIPVIAVGNLVAGGAGKTPTTLALARLLTSAREAPVIVTRGYGGWEKGPLWITTDLPARQVGDEPLVIAAEQPAIVARDRAAGVDLAIECGASVVLFDDGFQNPTVAKTVSLLVVDAGYGIGNGRILPAGPLRAPLDIQLAAADMVVLIRDPGGADVTGDLIALCAERSLPVFQAALKPVSAERFRNWPVIGFAGIGRPEKFAASLRDAGARVKEFVAFADHHVFTEREAEDLLARADRAGAQLVTTSKDWVRIDPGATGALGRLKAATDRFEIALAFDRPVDVMAMLTRRLRG